MPRPYAMPVSGRADTLACKDCETHDSRAAKRECSNPRLGIYHVRRHTSILHHIEIYWETQNGTSRLGGTWLEWHFHHLQLSLDRTFRWRGHQHRWAALQYTTRCSTRLFLSAVWGRCQNQTRPGINNIPIAPPHSFTPSTGDVDMLSGAGRRKGTYHMPGRGWTRGGGRGVV